MKKAKLTLLSLVISMAFVIQSCNNDEEIIDGFDETEIDDISITGNGIAHEWTDLMLRLEQYSQGRPNASARALAYIYLTAYETAVPGMTNYISVDERLRGLRIRDSERADEVDYQIALNTAFAKAIDHFLINVPENLTSEINALETEIESQLSTEVTEELLIASQEWGNYVVDQVISYSQSDDDAEEQILDPQPLSYEPPTGDGFWTYSADPERALFPYWGEKVRTFVIDPDETTTVDPIEYSEEEGSDYFAQMMEVYNVNNAARADQGEQLWIAEFWSDDVEGLMISPPARQFAIANQLIVQYDLSLDETLALYLKLGFSLNDAAVSAWKYKYEHMVMRPNVFIHEFIDEEFQTNLFRLVDWPNPSFPGYPSGHSTFASAAAGLFIDAFGDATNFTDRTHEGRTEFQSEPRTFSTFSDMAYENAFSRIPLGVHISMDCEEGLRLGYEISDAVNNWNLLSDSF
ncbi:vanadium-dependent haloperoxidase [Roseivirga sp.]|uniref:vanadium-dependent haloperoxidase n=1 Tax=Roseivirga sp. TaxID=1964215 RepID=UPI003B8C7749